MVLDHFYDVRVVHDAMRQRDLLDPQRFEVMDFGRRTGDAALSIRMEPYRCAVDKGGGRLRRRPAARARAARRP